MASSTHVILPSRTGAAFMGTVEIESDGALAILTTADHGYRSAHREYAAQHFGTRQLWTMNRLTWVNLHGVRVILTRWQTEAFRTA